MTTAFPKSFENLARLLQGALIDEDAFSRRIEPCRIDSCLGTCCHDGAYLTGEEAEVIRKLADSRREFFEGLGLDLPSKVVVRGEWRDEFSGPKTATKSFPMSERVPEYPSHFPDTNCVFQMETGECGLQRLSVEEGQHKWYYKPHTCWLHPITIVTDDTGQCRITLHSEKTDPQCYDDYDGFVCRTHCGRTCDQGVPAREVLSEELSLLEMLSKGSESDPTSSKSGS